MGVVIWNGRLPSSKEVTVVPRELCNLDPIIGEGKRLEEAVNAVTTVRLAKIASRIMTLKTFNISVGHVTEKGKLSCSYREWRIPLLYF